MSSAIRFKDHLEGANNFTAWKLQIMMILDENKVDSFVKDKRTEPKNERENHNGLKTIRKL